MKNSILLVVMGVIWISSMQVLGQANCTPATSAPIDGGFFPPDSTQPCAIRNQPYNLVIQIKNFGQVATGVTVESTRIDTFYNLPSGLSWSMNVPSGNPANTLLTGQFGCIEITGTPTDAAGTYVTDVYVTVKVNINGNTNTVGGRASQLVPVLNTQFGTDYDLSYRIFLVNNANECSNTSGIGNNSALSNFNIFPNPSHEKIVLSADIRSGGQYNVMIHDIAGKILTNSHITLAPGYHTIPLSIENLKRGFYFVTLKNSTHSLTRQLLVD